MYVNYAGFNHHALELRFDNPASSSFEAEARNQRHAILTKACLQQSLGYLLFSHHLFDQIETALLRLSMGSKAYGLAGMLPVVSSPCNDRVYNAENVKFLRPFLNVPKTRLIETAKISGIEWYEDSTNHDPSYGKRNVVRSLLLNEQELPAALQSASLYEMMQEFQIQRQQSDFLLQEIIKRCFRLQVVPSMGIIKLRPRYKMISELDHRVVARVLAYISEKVMPQGHVLQSGFEPFVDNFLNAQSMLTPTFTKSNTQWTYYPGKRNGENKFWVVSRQYLKPNKLECIDIHLTGGKISERVMWDNRWWIQVEGPPGIDQEYRLRPMHLNDLKTLKQNLQVLEHWRHWTKNAESAKGKARFMIPILEKKVADTDGGMEYQGNKMVALPTLGISFDQDIKVKSHHRSLESSDFEFARFQIE